MSAIFFAPGIDLAELKNYQLRPMACVVEGFVVWCNEKSHGSFSGPDAPRILETIAISSPRKPVQRPPGASIACLSVADYRRVTAAIADLEEAPPVLSGQEGEGR